MTSWLLWRLVKWLGLCVLAWGVFGTVRNTGTARRNAAFWVLPLGLLTVFISGYGLLEHSQLEFSEPWVLASLAAGVASASGAVLHATSPRSRLGAGFTVAGLTGALGFMVFRDGGLLPGVLTGVLGLPIGALLASEGPDEQATDEVLRWFRWIGRAEGVSLLVLFGIAMPLKYAAGQPFLISWTGWLHGVLFLLYVGALVIGVLRLGWSLVDAVLGFVAAFLPFGTFLFERRVHE